MNSNIYWENVERNFKSQFTCPNRTFFRFVHHNNIIINNKNVLDIGFGLGEDLYEMKKRGANAYGIDIDARMMISDHENNKYPQVIIGDCETKLVEFNLKFDLIYSLETFYYFDDSKLSKCLNSVHSSLENNGKFILQLIIADYEVIDGKYVLNSNIINSKGRLENNPVKYRSKEYYKKKIELSNFTIIGEKIVQESFFVKLEAIRENYYLCLKKNN